MDYLHILRSNDVKGLEKYLETHIVNEEVQGESLLYWAVYMDHQKFCKLLIEQGADVNQKDRNGRSPLSTACYFGFTAISRLLLKHGARIDASCLDRAYWGWGNNVQVETLELLRDYGWVNIFMDDLRDTPEGFVVGARTMKEAIEAIERYHVHILSLDHDLGMDDEGNLRKTGYDLVKYICENGIRAANKIFLHSANVVGRENMYKTLKAAQKRKIISHDIGIYPYPFVANRYTGD